MVVDALASVALSSSSLMVELQKTSTAPSVLPSMPHTMHWHLSGWWNPLLSFAWLRHPDFFKKGSEAETARPSVLAGRLPEQCARNPHLSDGGSCCTPVAFPRLTFALFIFKWFAIGVVRHSGSHAAFVNSPKHCQQKQRLSSIEGANPAHRSSAAGRFEACLLCVCVCRFLVGWKDGWVDRCAAMLIGPMFQFWQRGDDSSRSSESMSAQLLEKGNLVGFVLGDWLLVFSCLLVIMKTNPCNEDQTSPARRSQGSRISLCSNSGFWFPTSNLCQSPRDSG
jgi:hypothetical protein